jgi:hypothetical protein
MMRIAARSVTRWFKESFSVKDVGSFFAHLASGSKRHGKSSIGASASPIGHPLGLSKKEADQNLRSLLDWADQDTIPKF